MCGISGIYKFGGGEIREADLTRMRETLIHRGPDGGANFISKDKKVGLSQRRLAIIDLSSEAACPMRNVDGTVWITFNGEIYNFQELRADLKKLGYKFKTQGDTEAIIYGYEAYGPDVVKRLNGMFAFVLWDEKKRVLLAARDHIGVKPLYWAIQNGAFYFGSEIKALLAHPDFKKELAEENISHYLTFACMPAPLTLFRDVQKLKPAHYITISPAGEVRETEYWNPLAASGPARSENDYIEEVRSLLKDSIEKQTVSDVPFGCFLSGGIDSSLNATLMSEAMGKPVETFSVGSKEFGKYNEFEYSRLIAKNLKANTHELSVDQKDLMNFLPQYAEYADDPNGDQICFLIFYLSKLIRESGVVVAQVGEGADELFAGYPSYHTAVNLHERVWRHLEHLPGALRSLPQKALSPFSQFGLGFSKEYARRLAQNEEPFWGNAIAFTPTDKDSLLTSDFGQKLKTVNEYSIPKAQYDEIEKLDPEADFLKRLTYLELKVRLPELLLMRVDKMAMAHSVEARVPFLDRRLVELGLQIPQGLKLKNNTTKYILKKAAEKFIPREVIYRKKKGFAAPLTEWLRGKDTAKPFLETILNSKLKNLGLLNYDYVKEMFAAHQKGSVNANFQIWNLVSLSLWYDRWFA